VADLVVPADRAGSPGRWARLAAELDPAHVPPLRDLPGHPASERTVDLMDTLTLTNVLLIIIAALLLLPHLHR
jgi:hypothetical protein